MPNWCSNRAVITGPSPVIAEIKQRLAQADPELLSWMVPQPKFEGDQDWYQWNVNNWGTKWDVAVHNDDKYSDTDLQDEDEYSLCYRFNTAWGIPEEAIMTLTEQYPRLMLDLEFEEETGWGGRTTYQMNDFGVLRTIESEWNWKCMECDYCELNDPLDNYCEDCEEIVCPECNSNNHLNDKCQTHGVQSDPTTTTEEE